MINGDLKAKVDRVWEAFWTGGMSNGLQAIEQITYLLFIRRLDDLQTLKENKSRTLGLEIEDPIFSESQSNLRWSTFKHFDAQNLFNVVRDGVFPFLKEYAAKVDGDGSTYSEQLKDAQFNIPTASLLTKVVDLLDEIPMVDRDTNGDLYEYLLSQLSTAGRNGQFRTPRHIIELMVDLVAPKPTDEICDPAVGTAGFLVVASEYIRKNYPEALSNEESRFHFHRAMFHGYDNDQTMVRIGAMNLLLHGIEQPEIIRQDSLAEPMPGGKSLDSERFSLILANPPFSGSLDKETVATSLQRIVKTTKTELLFLAAIIKLLKVGGRAAVVVPDGILFGSSNVHTELRRVLVEDQKLEAVIKLPNGVFKPYAGVSTAILLFTKTNSGGTDNVWFYDLRTDGFSLDDRRAPIGTSDLDDIRRRWELRFSSELGRTRVEQSFCVPKTEIVEQNYELMYSKYREMEKNAVQYRTPKDIIEDLQGIQKKLDAALTDLEGLL